MCEKCPKFPKAQADVLKMLSDQKSETQSLKDHLQSQRQRIVHYHIRQKSTTSSQAGTSEYLVFLLQELYYYIILYYIILYLNYSLIVNRLLYLRTQ